MSRTPNRSCSIPVSSWVHRWLHQLSSSLFCFFLYFWTYPFSTIRYSCGFSVPFHTIQQRSI